MEINNNSNLTIYLKKYLLYFLILVYVSGSVGFVMNPSFFSPYTPYTLLFTCFVYLLQQPNENLKFIISFFAIAILGYIIEVIGVKTGLIFGVYQYGSGLGYKLLDVPLIISLNWALLITAGIITVSRFFKNKYIVLVISALLITIIDLLIEQVAYKLDFWQFSSGLPELHNYIGWLLVAFISPYFFYSKIIKGNKNIASIILILQLIFFGTIYIFI